MSVITIERKVLEKNDEIASQNRSLLKSHGIFTINIVSSPGAGKTSLLERTLEELGSTLQIGVIEGDVSTDIDAQRVARLNAPVVQIITNGGCHLEAKLVQDALAKLNLQQTRMLIIENVGNLVCPSTFDLGEAFKLVVASVPEGHDKPYKYTSMFMSADVIVLNKKDLMPYIDFDRDSFYKGVRAVNQKAPVFEISCRTGEGVQDFICWVRKRVQARA